MFQDIRFGFSFEFILTFAFPDIIPQLKNACLKNVCLINAVAFGAK